MADHSLFLDKGYELLDGRVAALVELPLPARLRLTSGHEVYGNVRIGSAAKPELDWVAHRAGTAIVGIEVVPPGTAQVRRDADALHIQATPKCERINVYLPPGARADGVARDYARFLDSPLDLDGVILGGRSGSFEVTITAVEPQA
jgi:hypothetical protein